MERNILKKRWPSSQDKNNDRGSQYTSYECRQITQTQGIQLSMSAKGYCYDDAAQSIFEYVEVFYNRQRIHSTLGYLSPLEFEEQHINKHLQIGAIG